MKTTEQTSPYSHLDEMSTTEILQGINDQDNAVAKAVTSAIPDMEKLVDGIVERVRKGGRVFYLGAGTSGRLGILDASEIPPTYGVRNLFIGLIAGGDAAIRTGIEGAEDDVEGGWRDMQQFNPTSNDILIGIAASGTTPYVIGAIERANSEGMLTGCITCNEGSEVAQKAQIPVVVVVGPEFVTGSTRMKAGTAEKMVLNMISTATMIRLGHVRGNKMIDMQLTNSKLVDRGTRMIMSETGISDYDKAKALLLEHKQVRKAIEAWKMTKIFSVEKVDKDF